MCTIAHDIKRHHFIDHALNRHQGMYIATFPAWVYTMADLTTSSNMEIIRHWSEGSWGQEVFLI